MIIIQLNERQLKIIAIVKENEPITGEKIAEKLRVTRATLRSDLVVLTMTGILDARPKVGYFYVGEGNFSNENTSMKNTKVSSVMGVPLTARQSDSVYDVIVNIFLLKATVGGSDVNKLPVGMIMTRMPNIATVEEDESINLAAAKLMKREVDSLPVIRYEDDDKQKMKVVGKISKTIINRLFVELTE